MRKLATLYLSLMLVAFSLGLEANEGGGEKKEGAALAGPQYVPLEPVLVNLEGRRHYLRVVIQLLVEDAATSEKIGANMPAIRDTLIILLSGRNPDDVTTMSEREKLRIQARDAVRKVMEHFHADKGVKDLFFTDFMVQ